jgi:parvulin-like peptidyl-prolyl isomerase
VHYTSQTLARCALSALAALATFQAAAAEPPLPADTFAVVGKVTLTSADFQTTFMAAARDKFYHSKPPEAEIAAYQREVGEDLINRVLAVEEAKRRGLKPDAREVQQRVEQFETRSRHAPNWEKERSKRLAAITTQFENQSLFEQLKAEVRKVPAASEAQARAYYDANKGLFVEPEKLRMSVILLKVDPSSPKATWDKTRGEVAALRKRIAAGEDFAMLARRHSGDATAKDGGDMGYLHRGMLPDGTDKVVEALKPGEVSEPVTLLDGVALLKLNERKPAQQRSFNEVRQRAGELWQRDEAEKQWKTLLADLRKKTPVRVNEALYMPLPKPAAPRAG